MRGRQNRTTALQQHAATYSTVLLFSVATQIWILNKEIPTMLHCMMRLPLHRAKDPQQHLFCQFVMRCSASNCAAGLPKLPPTPFFSLLTPSPPQFTCRCTSKLWKRFQGASKVLNEIWTAVEKLPKDFNQSDRLAVQRAGSVSGKQEAIAIASSLGVKWWQK